MPILSNTAEATKFSLPLWGAFGVPDGGFGGGGVVFDQFGIVYDIFRFSARPHSFWSNPDLVCLTVFWAPPLLVWHEQHKAATNRMLPSAFINVFAKGVRFRAQPQHCSEKQKHDKSYEEEQEEEEEAEQITKQTTVITIIILLRKKEKNHIQRENTTKHKSKKNEKQ